MIYEVDSMVQRVPGTFYGEEETNKMYHQILWYLSSDTNEIYILKQGVRLVHMINEAAGIEHRASLMVTY